jgi:hypothetical protein
LPQAHGPRVPLGQFGGMPLQFTKAFEQLFAVPRQEGEKVITVVPVMDGQLLAQEEMAPQHEVAAQRQHAPEEVVDERQRVSAGHLAGLQQQPKDLFAVVHAGVVAQQDLPQRFNIAVRGELLAGLGDRRSFAAPVAPCFLWHADILAVGTPLRLRRVTRYLTSGCDAFRLF